MIKHIVANWKTTSAGVLAIGGATFHLIYRMKDGSADEGTWTLWLTSVIGGLGLILAGDAGASLGKAEVQTDVDTGFLKASDVKSPQPPKP